nr:glycosyltransferase family 9 protein [Candidatus Eremiobacteraeota bacterium]
RRLALRLRGAGPYEAAYLAQGSVRSAALAVLAGCRERVGFDTSRNARLLYTHVVPYPADRHHAERLWSLARPDRVPSAAEIQPRLYPGIEDEGAVDEVLAPVAELIGAGVPLVALAPGSVWATKRWPYYAELGAVLAREAVLVVVGGRGDAELGAAIVRVCPAGRVVDATGRLSVLASAALIGQAALLVTNDSAPQHLASAVGTRTLTIFGPTVPAFGFGPLAPGSATAGVDDLACRPCDRHGPRVCPLGHWRCMREQPADRVLALLRGAGMLPHLG